MDGASIFEFETRDPFLFLSLLILFRFAVVIFLPPVHSTGTGTVLETVVTDVHRRNVC